MDEISIEEAKEKCEKEDNCKGICCEGNKCELNKKEKYKDDKDSVSYLLNEMEAMMRTMTKMMVITKNASSLKSKER